MMSFDSLLKSIYYDPSNPASYAGVQKLLQEAKKYSSSITAEDVRDWLSGQLTYTLHRDARKNYNRNKIFVSAPLEQYQADLVDMQKFSRQNSGYKYLLTAIDCFSRYAYAEPLKSKKPEEIIRALKIIFKDYKPFKFQTDRGLEFVNKHVKNFLKDNGIHFFTSFNSDIKCSMIERFNRTLKAKMFKDFNAAQLKGNSRYKYRYIENLPKLVKAYNNTVHRTIGIEPSKVTDDNKDEIFRKIYGVDNPVDYYKQTRVKPKLAPGDKVRVKYHLTSMDKGYYPKWTDHIFTIKSAIPLQQRPMYKLVDGSGKVVDKRFYPEEVQKVKENFYRIEKIIKRETRGGIPGFIVKWIDYPTKYNSWVSEHDIVNFSNE
jgi:transposase InsO family protein